MHHVKLPNGLINKFIYDSQKNGRVLPRKVSRY